MHYEIWSRYDEPESDCLGIEWNYKDAISQSHHFVETGHRTVEVYLANDYEGVMWRAYVPHQMELELLS